MRKINLPKQKKEVGKLVVSAFENVGRKYKADAVDMLENMNIITITIFFFNHLDLVPKKFKN